MNSPLTVLLLEDNPDDAELVVASLAADEIACKLVRVESRTGYLAAIEEHRLDLILSDYGLPSFDGVSALKIAQEKLPNVPFIFVSGTMGEELAIETLKSGATDYVLKHRLGRLGPAVRRAMAETAERLARREAERSRAEAWEMETLLLEASPDATLIAGADRIMKRVNRQMEIMFGYSREEVIGQSVAFVLPALSEKESQCDGEGLRKNGETFPVDVALSDLTTKAGPLLIITIRDISYRKKVESELTRVTNKLQVKVEDLERTKADLLERTNLLTDTVSQLKSVLSERSLLLREVHHRVRNNLAVIASLLNIQAQSTLNAHAEMELQHSQRRIQSMAMIHEHAYAVDNFDRIDFADYVRRITDRLYHSLAPTPELIKVLLELKPTELELDQSIPCGLILNELLSNAFRHAFADGRSGEVAITLCERESEIIELSIRDNGLGMNPNMDWRNQKSFGLQLVQILTAQIGGTVTLEASSGTHFVLKFRVNGTPILT